MSLGEMGPFNGHSDVYHEAPGPTARPMERGELNVSLRLSVPGEIQSRLYAFLRQAFWRDDVLIRSEALEDHRLRFYLRSPRAMAEGTVEIDMADVTSDEDCRAFAASVKESWDSKLPLLPSPLTRFEL